MVLSSRLQDELLELTSLTRRSHVAVIFEDLTDVRSKIVVQSNKIACNCTEEFERVSSIWDVVIEEKG
jgi:hypothetical protein